MCRQSMPSGLTRWVDTVAHEMLPLTLGVIPGRRKAANPESITPVGEYGFRALLAALGSPE